MHWKPCPFSPRLNTRTFYYFSAFWTSGGRMVRWLFLADPTPTRPPLPETYRRLFWKLQSLGFDTIPAVHTELETIRRPTHLQDFRSSWQNWRILQWTNCRATEQIAEPSTRIAPRVVKTANLNISVNWLILSYRILRYPDGSRRSKPHKYPSNAQTRWNPMQIAPRHSKFPFSTCVVKNLCVIYIQQRNNVKQIVFIQLLHNC